MHVRISAALGKRAQPHKGAATPGASVLDGLARFVSLHWVSVIDLGGRAQIGHGALPSCAMPPSAPPNPCIRQQVRKLVNQGVADFLLGVEHAHAQINAPIRITGAPRRGAKGPPF